MIDLESAISRHDFKRLLLAVSGGLDSICLAHYFITNRKRLGIEWLGIAHVHHGLREGTADRDAEFVKNFAEAHGVPFFLKKLDGAALKDADGSLEENARDARYKALVEVINEINNEKLKIKNVIKQKNSSLFNFHSSFAIVTAHHAGDQSETMYMRLRRGTTLAGLRGIQEVRTIQDYKTLLDGARPQLFGSVMPMQAWSQHSPSELSSASPQNDIYSIYLFRPFLNVTRAELLAYARENGLSWCEDESNADVKFARNKIRHEFLPNLERECPGAIKQLCRIADVADKAYAKVMAKCENVFAPCLLDESSLDEEWRSRNKVRDDSAIRAVALDKKKLNKILRDYANADLSEILRLWLSEKGFRFPIGFFYAPKEPAHIKIPVRAVYRKRSILKIRHTVWICEFNDTESAAKFVSWE